MGLLDDFVTDMSKDKEEVAKEKEEKEKGPVQGSFDGQYSSQFLEYCNKGNR